MEAKFIVPGKDLLVPDPIAGGFLPAHGRYINASEIDTYWQRRLQDGSVTLVDVKEDGSLVTKKSDSIGAK